MADISDVLTAAAQTIAAAIYPSGTSSPSATGAATRIYPGWPAPQQLDTDLAAGTVNVSVYPLPSEKTESLVNLNAATQSIAAAGTTLSVSGATVTVGGSPKIGDVAVIGKNYTSYAYAVTSTDTTATIAAQLASLIGGTASGSVVTAPSGTFDLTALVSTPGTMLQPMRRINRMVQITCWAPTPALRDATAKLVDAGLWNAERLTMPDGTSCGITYQTSPMTDMLERVNLYRRDIIVQAQFVTTQTETAQTVGDFAFNQSSTATPVVSFDTLNGN